jgi:thiamine pyrophosphokinase
VSDKENTKYFTDTKKCGGEKTAQRRSRLRFLGARGGAKSPPQQLPFVMCCLPFFYNQFYFGILIIAKIPNDVIEPLNNTKSKLLIEPSLSIIDKNNAVPPKLTPIDAKAKLIIYFLIIICLQIL